MSGHVTASELRNVVKRAEKLYADRYQRQYESEFPGQFVVIDITTGKAFVAQFPEDAITTARAASKDGVLHLIRIGEQSAFQLAFFAHQNADLARAL